MGGSSNPTYNNAGLFNLSDVAGQNIASAGYAMPQAYSGAYDTLAGLSAYYPSSGQYGYNPWGVTDLGNRLSNLSQQSYNQATGAIPSLYGMGNQVFDLAAAPTNLLQSWGQQGVQAGQIAHSALMPYVSQALQQGFDPQQALYGKLFQQQQDQAQAANAAAGVATTPYGAALTQQGNQNFDIAWQQAQLANQAQGAQTAANLTGAGMGAMQTGYGIGQGMYGLGLQGLQTGANAAANLYGTAIGSVGTGANAAAQLGSTGANISSLPMQLQNQQMNSAVADYLNFINASNQGGSQLMQAINNAYGTTNSLYGTQGNINYNNNLLNSQALSGLGSLGGNLLGGYLYG